MAGELWNIRRAEIERLRQSETADAEHHARIAAALAEFHQTRKRIAEESRSEEIVALETAASSDREGSSLEDRAMSFRVWTDRVADIRSEAEKHISAAYRKLSEQQHNAWLDLIDHGQEARRAHFRMLDRAAVDEGAPSVDVSSEPDWFWGGWVNMAQPVVWVLR